MPTHIPAIFSSLSCTSCLKKTKCSIMALQNANPVVYQRAKERELTNEEQDEDFTDRIDEREVFDILFVAFIRHIA